MPALKYARMTLWKNQCVERGAKHCVRRMLKGAPSGGKVKGVGNLRGH